MAANLPPRPWHYLITAPEGRHQGSGHVYLIDANNRKIASLWGTADEKIALAQLIINASEAASKRSNHGESSAS